MNSMITTHPTDAEVRRAAEELVTRHGRGAIATAARRAEALASEGRWPEHSVAARVLTVVEQLTGSA